MVTLQRIIDHTLRMDSGEFWGLVIMGLSIGILAYGSLKLQRMHMEALEKEKKEHK